MNHDYLASTSKDDRKVVAGILLALLSGLSYSSEAIAAKLLYARGLPPLTVLTWRFLLAALIFTLWACRQNAFLVKPSQRRLLALLGLFQAVTVLFLFYAFMYIPAGLAVFLFYLYPTLLTLIEVLFLGIQPNKKRILALMFTLVGLLVIAGPVVNNISWPGFACALAAAIGNAVFLLLSGHSLDELPVTTVSAGTTLSAAAALVLAAIATRTPLSFALDGSTISLLLFLVLVPSVLALTCLLAAIARLGPGRTAIVATTEPFFTVLLGFLILGEHLRLHELIGGIIIIFAVLIERSGN
ncbi:MAG TPA: DMT family transporter [Firmicutes bacterium]|nr:DMT family transporter [Bacillota bacterium]